MSYNIGVGYSDKDSNIQMKVCSIKVMKIENLNIEIVTY